MFGFVHPALPSVHISSNTRDRPDSPGSCAKCFGKAEPSKSLSLSLLYLNSYASPGTHFWNESLSQSAIVKWRVLSVEKSVYIADNKSIS